MVAVINDGGVQAQRVYIHDIDMFVNQLYDQAIRFDATGCSGVIENVRVSDATLLAGGEVMLLDSSGAEPGWTVRNNIIRTAKDGIVIEAGDTYIHDNEFINCATAITLASGTNEIVIGPNTFRDVTTPITDSNTGTIYETLTTKGDLRGFDTANARIPVGTDTHVLIADSVQALGVKWGLPSGVGSPLTTKGDVHGFTTIDARLAVGTNGQIIVADSAQGLGIKWDDLGQWQTWTPTYTNLTVGNGTVVSRYVQIGKTIHAVFEITFGSTSSMGTGPTISLPVTAASTYTTPRHNLGPAYILDAGTIAFQAAVRLESTTTASVGVLAAGATHLTQANITATVPMTWTTSDLLSFTASYEAA